MHLLFRQVRHAVRGLARQPGYAAVAVLTLALGLGASTAIFTVVNAVLLRPLPFDEPDRLVYLRESKLPQLPEFSVAPGNFLVWQAQRDTLNAGGRGAQAGLRRGTRRALVVIEIALAALLVATAGLLARSFQHLQQVDPGFVASDAFVASLALPDGKNPARADRFRFYRSLAERLAAIPGVRAAGVTASLPLDNDYVGGVTTEGRPPVSPTERQPSNYYSVSPGYFAAMGIRLLRGRLFSEQDGPDAPRVCIISETFAKRFFPNEDPLGKRAQISMGPDAWREVVGMVADTKQYGLTEDATSQFYDPYGQLTLSSMTLVVRTAGDPASVAPALRDAVHALDPDLPIGQVRTLDDLPAQSIGPQRFSTLLLGTFAVSALFLAVIGLYGVLAYAVGQQTLEIGVRMAHGARSANILTMFLRESLGLALASASRARCS